MFIKKFKAPTLQEAMVRMKEELGKEAVVLSTKIIEDDLGFDVSKMFEITAGLDEDKMPDTPAAVLNSAEKPARGNFQSELHRLTNKIYHTTDDIKVSGEELPTAGKTENKEDFLTKVENELTDKEINKSVISKIILQLKKYEGFLKDEELEDQLISTISSMIPTSSFHLDKGKKTKVISLVGPTGVGKTTCIAKLAVISKILHNLDIGLISIDTYRLGALDQLKIFSEVSDIDFLVAYEPNDLKKHLEKFRKKDLVFIDTAGRSQNNLKLLQGAKKFLDSVKADETYLVLNTTSTTKTLLDTAEKFQLFDYTGFVFTKLDEAAAFGNILNVVSKFNYPVAYLTNGQVIPDDIIAADPEFIASAIYTGNIN